jgi:hypothetical protein
MTSLSIKDLSRTLVLDREAASAVRGGTTTLPVEPDGGNGSGPLVVPPWPMPAMPALPDFFPMLPGWCGTPAPQEPTAPISRPPAHPTLLQ